MRQILIERGFGETRLALVEGDRLTEFRLSRGEERHRPGSIHLGRVISIDPSLDAAFVEIGDERPGLLPLRDAGKNAPSAGDAMLVQVTRAGIEDKGVRLSARLSISGRAMALRPGRGGIAFAPNLADPEERERVRSVLKQVLSSEAGVAVERGAAGLQAEILRGEAERLITEWREISTRAQSGRAPVTLHAGRDAVERALLDWASSPIEILCNDRALVASVAMLLIKRLPDVAATPRVDPRPGLFEAEGVEEQLEAALAPEAPIGGGGFLLIEPGRTLTAIDVNSGADDRRPRDINLAAAEEIAHQLRLRAIGGLVVIDFIDLRTPSARGPALERLSEALAPDPAGCELAGATRLGLVELTRRRTGPSLAELLTEPCGYGGSGRVRRVETIGSQLLRRVATEARTAPGRRFTLHCAPELASAFRSVLAGGLAELEARLGRPLAIVADPSMKREDAHITVDERPGTHG
jgi:Rne/Rng family ribonuclease